VVARARAPRSPAVQDFRTRPVTFLRERQPPALIVWGQNDPAFIAAGATACLRDLPGAELHLLDAGHFAVEEQAVEVARLIVHFMEQLPP